MKLRNLVAAVAVALMASAGQSADLNGAGAGSQGFDHPPHPSIAPPFSIAAARSAASPETAVAQTTTDSRSGPRLNQFRVPPISVHVLLGARHSDRLYHQVADQPADAFMYPLGNICFLCRRVKVEGSEFIPLFHDGKTVE